jgi:hypothetical protein
VAVNTTDGGGRGFPWSLLGWAGAAGLLLVPLIFSFPWDAFDFAVAGVMLALVGIGLELVFRLSRDNFYRLGTCAAIGAGFLTVWATGAVGMVGDEGDPYNLIFLGIVLLALIGAGVVRLRPGGMAAVMALAAAAQLVAGLGGMSIDWRGGIFSAGFAAIWGVSALFFLKAAQDRKQGVTHANG